MKAYLRKLHGDEVPEGTELPPELPPIIHTRGLRIIQDRTGREAAQALFHLLPLSQQRLVMYVLAAMAPHVRLGRPHATRRRDVGEVREAIDDRTLAGFAQLKTEAELALPTVHGRRVVQAAVCMYGLSKSVAPKSRGAWRGAHRKVDGFCANAIAWGCPNADGSVPCRSTLWGPQGPFALLGGYSHSLRRDHVSETGVGIWNRWQPRAFEPGVRHVGPPKRDPETGEILIDPKTGEPIRYAVGMVAYKREMCGRTAAEALRYGSVYARQLAEVMADPDDADDDHVELHEPPPAVSDAVSAELSAALAAPVATSTEIEPRPPPE